MKISLFEKLTSNLTLENRLLKFVVVVVGASNLFLAYRVDLAVKHQRTVLIPANLDARTVVTDGYASEDYIKSFARTITNLAFTYSPSTVRGQFGELLQLFTPEAFTAAKQHFWDMATTVESTKTSAVFFMSKPPTIDTAKSVMVIEGTQRLWVDTIFIDTQQKTYSVEYKIVNGRFMIHRMQEIKKGAAPENAKQVGGPIKVTTEPNNVK